MYEKSKGLRVSLLVIGKRDPSVVLHLLEATLVDQGQEVVPMGEETDLVLLYVDPAIIGHGGIETKIADSLDGFKKPVIMISQFGTTPVPWSFILGGIVASMRLEHAGSDLVAA